MKSIFGYFGLYFKNNTESWIAPEVNCSYAGIEYIVEFTYMPGEAPNIFMGEGTLESRLLKAVSASTYVIYENHEYRSYVAAYPQWT